MKQLSKLADARKKVGAKGYRVAVIGPMKAGKSTAVNTMVGISIAPKRLEAMTQIATLITHAPGQDIPILEFNPAPFAAAIKMVRKVAPGAEMVTKREENEAAFKQRLARIESQMNQDVAV